MTATPTPARARVAIIIVAVAAFAAVFHEAHRERLALKPLQDSATTFHRICMFPRAYAQTHDGQWPTLSASPRAFALPLADLPRGYTIAPRFDVKMTEPIPAMLVGTLNNAAAYTLKPIDAIASEYIYFGYAVTNEDEFAELVRAIRNGAPPDRDIPVEKGRGTLGSSTLYRLRNKFEKTLAAAGVTPQADPAVLDRMPVVMERPHDGLVWVQFLNGRMARMPYPSSFPACAAVVDAAGGTMLPTPRP